MQLVFIIGTASIKIAEVIIGNIGKRGGKKMTDEEKKMFKQWLCLNGDEGGSLYMTFSDEELEQIFLTAIEVYEKNKR